VALSPQGSTAWDDQQSRRTVRNYGARAIGIALLCIPLALVGSLFITGHGHTKPGVPDFVSLIPIGAACGALLLGALTLLNAARIRWTLRRWPWRTMSSTFEEVATGFAPNGQPVLTLDSPGQHQVLTLNGMKWRWRRFDQPQLLVAGRPGHGAVVATLDRRCISWAGRSPMTRFLLPQRGRGRRT
jgi:hypothetical protein